MNELNFHEKKIDFGFVAGLFLLFSITSFLLILIGVKQYQNTSDIMNINYEDRTVSSFLQEKIRQYDDGGQLSISTIDGYNAITMTSDINGIVCKTYLYYYDGYVRELMITKGSVYSANSGQTIISGKGMTAELTEEQLIKVNFTDSENNNIVFYFSHKSGS